MKLLIIGFFCFLSKPLYIFVSPYFYNISHNETVTVKPLTVVECCTFSTS
jgi:hypothetical protein